MRTFFFVLILVVFVLFLLSLRFGQISPLAFFRWFTATSNRNDESCNRIPVITAFHSCCLSHHVFDQVNLWPARVGFETAIFWQCSPGTVETQHLYPLRHGPVDINIIPTNLLIDALNIYIITLENLIPHYLYLSLNWLKFVPFALHTVSFNTTIYFINKTLFTYGISA